MQPQRPQVDSPQGPLSHSALTATLAHATNLQESLQPQAPAEPAEPQTAPQEAPQAPQAQVEPKVEEKPKEEKQEPKNEDLTKLELSITDRLDAIRKELKDDQRGQIDSLRKEIENALNSEK